MTTRKKTAVEIAVTPNTDGMPAALADQFTVVDDGWWLEFESRMRGTVRLPLDLDLDTLVEVVDFDMSAMDAKNVAKVRDVLRKLLGEDAGRVGSRELLAVIERWAWELGRAMAGVSLGE